MPHNKDNLHWFHYQFDKLDKGSQRLVHISFLHYHRLLDLQYQRLILQADRLNLD